MSARPMRKKSALTGGAASRARPWGRPGRSGGEAHRAGAFPSHGRGAGGVVDDGADHGRAVDERVGDRGPGGAPRV